MTTKIYSYGVYFRTCPPKVDQLLRRADRYYNCLIELENLRREAFAGIELDSSPELTMAELSYRQADQAAELAAEAIKEHRKRTRARSVPPELADAKTLANEARKAASERLRAVKKAHREALEFADEERLRRIVVSTSKALMSDLKDLTGKELTKAVKEIRARDGEPGPRTLERVNAEVLEQMLGEEQFPKAWRDQQILSSVMLSCTKQARAISDLPHGTYSLVEDAVAAARKAKKAGDLDRRWCMRQDELPVDRSGRIGVQLTGGLSIEDLLSGKSPRLKIVPESVEEMLRKNPGKSPRWVRRNRKAKAFLAIDSGDDGWEVLEIPDIHYHRELPPGSVIKWAWLFVSRLSGRLKFDLQLTLDIPEVDIGENRRAEVCALNLGWRNFPDGSIRVGYITGSDGHEQEFRLPAPTGPHAGGASILQRFARADAIRSASDLHFNEAVSVMRDILETEVPSEIRDACRNISSWHDHCRLRRVVTLLVAATCGQDSMRDAWWEWRSLRMTTRSQRRAGAVTRDLLPTLSESRDFLTTRPIDPRVFYLYCWKQKDEHLIQLSFDTQRKSSRHRDDLFRQWARRIADRYQLILIADEGIKKRGEKEEPGKETVTDSFRRNLRRVAPGGLKDAIVAAVGKDRFITDDPVDASATCIFCHAHSDGLDLAGDVMFRCTKCQKLQDQDSSNTHCRLDRYRESHGAH